MRLDYLELEHMKWEARRTRMTKNPEYFDEPVPKFTQFEGPDGKTHRKISDDYLRLSDMQRMRNDMAPVIVHGSGGRGVDQDAILDKLIENEAKHEAVVKEAINIEKEIRTQIDKLPNQYDRFVLEYHYILGEDLKDIARLMHYSERQVIRFHNRALRRFIIPDKDVTQCHPESC